MKTEPSRAVLSFVMHISAFASVVLACAYTCTALALLPFSYGAVLGAIFYLVLLLIVWDGSNSRTVSP
jgi:hypothetical protein